MDAPRGIKQEDYRYEEHASRTMGRHSKRGLSHQRPFSNPAAGEASNDDSVAKGESFRFSDEKWEAIINGDSGSKGFSDTALLNERLHKRASHRKPRKIRNSSIEMLRILAMLMITAHHFLGFSDISLTEQKLSVKKILLETFLYSGGKIGVVIFFAISAWYLSDSTNIRGSLRRAWLLEREVLFWSLACLAFTFGYDRDGITPNLLLKSVFPIAMNVWWYATAYCVFLIVFPVFAPALRSLGKSKHGYLCCALFMIWTIFEGFVPVFSLGLHGGDFLSFVYLYALLTYYKWYMRPITVRCAWAMISIGYALILLCAVAFGILFDQTGKFASGQLYFSGTEYKLPVILVGFGVFVLFQQKTYHSSIVNTIAASAFSVYLLTDHPIILKYIWHDWFNLSSIYQSPIVGVLVVSIVFVVYALCMVLDMLRVALFRLTFDRHRGRLFDIIADHVATCALARYIRARFGIEGEED
ncbi:proline symporter [Bifidobacterium leontopitheci]|uniref:Proline symporter n=2 Tax=Bifidobacterium leontopitheci TaxID=2650774 RepID=A0A6I1GDJ3_9BIFI|nr:proline symporter [Bifidobacterium leontopitheci]